MKLKTAYRLALLEGEGLGTAYEYYVKFRLIWRVLGGFRPKSVLVYGLPEKYGYSLDFFHMFPGADLFEKRREKVAELFRLVEKAGLKKPTLVDTVKGYDLVLSCEVMQNGFDVSEFGKYIVFVPNGDNNGHLRFSGLRGLKLNEVKSFGSCGYVDMPPFPPGVKKKSESGWVVVWLLKMWYYVERVAPVFVKKRFAHVVYVTK